MIKTKLKIENIGTPNIQALSESEQNIFLETLFANMLNLYNASTPQGLSN